MSDRYQASLGSFIVVKPDFQVDWIQQVAARQTRHVRDADAVPLAGPTGDLFQIVLPRFNRDEA